MEEFKINLDGKEETITVSSIKARDAQKLWGVLKKFESMDENDNDAMKASEELQETSMELIKSYSGLTDEQLDDMTVDDISSIRSYLIDQAQKYITGFSIASQNAGSS